MLTVLLSMLALSLSAPSGAQGAGVATQSADSPSQSTDYLSKPPISIRKGPTCQCPDKIEDNVVILTGLVVDAEMTLAADGQSVNDRQATIFNLNPSSANDFNGRTKIWHSSNKAQCGLTFNYGAKYKLAARKTEDGALETDACLMRQMDKKAQD